MCPKISIYNIDEVEAESHRGRAWVPDHRMWPQWTLSSVKPESMKLCVPAAYLICPSLSTFTPPLLRVPHLSITQYALTLHLPACPICPSLSTSTSLHHSACPICPSFSTSTSPSLNVPFFPAFSTPCSIILHLPSAWLTSLSW